MKTPKEKYLNDPQYHHLVITLENLIESAQFTPSELREACILASINYEMRHIRSITITPDLKNAFRVMEDFIDNPKRRK
jgi:hypothetical protein